MHKRSSLEQGQSLVEIALVLPVLVILLLGIAEVGFLLFSHVQVANATRAGARYGSLCRFNDNCLGSPGLADLTAVVETAVLAENQTLKMNGTNTVVNVQPASLGSLPVVGTPITVTVTYTHSSIFVSNLVPMFPSEIPIQHTVVMHFDK
jgi:Flp pilus assembly protein TadG